MGLLDFRVGSIFVELLVDKLLHTVPQFHHAHDARFGGFVQLRPHHAGIFPVIHLAVHDGVRIVFHIRISRDGIVDFLVLTEIGQLRFGNLSLNMGNRLMELFGKIGVGERFARRFHLVPVHAVVPFDRPKHHFGMIGKIAVYGNPIFGLAEMHPIGLDDDGTVALLEKENIGGDFRSGVGLESVAGQTNRAE